MLERERCTGFESGESASIYIDGTLAAWGVGNGGSGMDTTYMTGDEKHGDGSSNERLESGLSVVDRVRHWCRHDTSSTSGFGEGRCSLGGSGPSAGARTRYRGLFFCFFWIGAVMAGLLCGVGCGGFPTSLYCTPDDGMDLGLFMFMCSKNCLLMAFVS